MKAVDLTDEKVAELKQQHGPDLEMYTLPNDDVVVVHAPTPFVWNRFQRDLASDKDKDKAKSFEQLVLGCRAAPSEIEAKALFQKYPAALVSLSEVVSKLGGGGGETKKL